MKQYTRAAVMACLLVAAIPMKAQAETKIINPYDETVTSSEDFIELLDSPYVALAETITPEQERMIASCCYYEANNQCLDGQRAVIEVIFNRVLSDRWPNTIEGVINQKGQFATAKAVRTKGYYTETQLDALQLVIEETPILPSMDYVFFDTKGRNGNDKFKLQGHWFGRQ